MTRCGQIPPSKPASQWTKELFHRDKGLVDLKGLGVRIHSAEPDCGPRTVTLLIVVQSKANGIDSVSAPRVDLAWERRWDRTRVSGAASPQIGSFR